MESNEARPNMVRDIAREAVRAHVTAVAVDLFYEFGFENVTIEQISEAAGISRRSFHRYFAAKEDVIVGDPTLMGAIVRDELERRPRSESAWVSLRLAFTHTLSQVPTAPAQGKRMIRILSGTAALRSRNLEKHLQWAEVLTPIIESRLSDEGREVRAQTLVHASLACLDVALLTWATSADDSDISATLERVFSELKSAT
jgi:AcrR family transcriptional regulator